MTMSPSKTALDKVDLPSLKKEILAIFECQKSGNCCKREGIVVVSLPDIQAMAAYLNIDPDTFCNRFVKRENGWSVIASKIHRPLCFLTDKNQCQVYPVRPDTCKTYPDWESLWEDVPTILEEIALCPGLKKAFDQVCT